MPFLGIFGGFETHQKQFFEIFEAKEQKEKTVKNRKKIGKNRTKEISVEISFRSPPISDILVEISEILFPALNTVRDCPELVPKISIFSPKILGLKPTTSFDLEERSCY